MAKFIDTLNPALKAEVAFATQKFNDLPAAEREKILKMLRSDDKSLRSIAALDLGNLLLNADSDELTKFINEKLGGGEKIFDIYLPGVVKDDLHAKCIMIGTYFIECMPPKGQNVIPMP